MRCEICGCTLFSCQCPDGPTNPLIEHSSRVLDTALDRLIDNMESPRAHQSFRIVEGLREAQESC